MSAHSTPRPLPLGSIAYHTFPPFEGQDIATATVSELLTRARQADPEVELFAHTLPEHNASNAILQKLGFEFLGEVATFKDSV